MSQGDQYTSVPPSDLPFRYGVDKKFDENTNAPYSYHNGSGDDSHYYGYTRGHHGWGWSWTWCWWCAYFWFLVAIVTLFVVAIATGSGVPQFQCTPCPSDMQTVNADLCIDLVARGPDDSFANVVNDCTARGLTTCPATIYDTCESLEAQTVIPFTSDCGNPASIGGVLDDFWTGSFNGPPGVGDHTCVAGNTGAPPFFPTRINCDTDTFTQIFWHCCAPQRQCAI